VLQTRPCRIGDLDRRLFAAIDPQIDRDPWRGVSPPGGRFWASKESGFQVLRVDRCGRTVGGGIFASIGSRETVAQREEEVVMMVHGKLVAGLVSVGAAAVMWLPASAGADSCTIECGGGVPGSGG
jgi:hypothetical protein